jgi:ketosteroid isomerase-like protein
MGDEQEIRDLFKNWIKSTTEGNLELAQQCIADDAVFFVPGIGEMDKETFAEGAAGGSPEESPIDFELDSKLRELKVFGDQAYL